MISNDLFVRDANTLSAPSFHVSLFGLSDCHFHVRCFPPIGDIFLFRHFRSTVVELVDDVSRVQPITVDHLRWYGTPWRS